ncbi:YeeE/YedE family protein [Bradyrhizobium sp. ISRA443]|uniref:DUF6691 family protein n=1 Tax=unclassified Bradyrhizobium TaxID=2631580 RepID=UPI002479708E|nr:MULTISPECIES: DUF6691 family protein [unclassified Bradyrhizobium]WGR95796.1 YeeE/YedE family protein [Bradyrhizobium sp. ISRA435]WGS00918.1 YeeE/YedE family protein [Bradyrhizobium sp. ISRA436]WGS07805.1 YeeE/YedE family protein [Bradyrhizobium sp. ISRA437]WGS14693.1 YeeE/YedE family protein [Bradyrhizobium sp. ISRA443]
MQILASFICGLIFGAGLLISGMTDPQKVLGFLDIFGAWDATLAFVMAGAVAVTAAGFALARHRTAPTFSARFLWPDRSDIDAPLVTGAVLFGIGWGLVGICPGPALVNLAGLTLPIVVFVVAMVVGMIGHEIWRRRTTAPRAVQSPALPSRADG